MKIQEFKDWYKEIELESQKIERLKHYVMEEIRRLEYEEDD